MSTKHADQETGPQSDSKNRNQGPPDNGWRIFLKAILAFMAVVGAYVEILLLCSYAQEHWNDLWFKFVAASFPLTTGIGFFAVLSGLAKWSKSSSAYVGVVVAIVLTAALVVAYSGDNKVMIGNRPWLERATTLDCPVALTIS